jgi:hypothetical protein
VPGNELLCYLSRSIGGRQSQSGLFFRTEELLFLLEFEFQIYEAHILVSIPTTLPGIHHFFKQEHKHKGGEVLSVNIKFDYQCNNQRNTIILSHKHAYQAKL